MTVSRSQPSSGHTPTPWTYRDVSGAGIEICAPVYEMKGVDLPRGMPEAPIHVFQFTSPQNVQISAERWVQFEPTGWHEMQMANAAFIVEAVNNYEQAKRDAQNFGEAMCATNDRLLAAQDRIQELEGALKAIELSDRQYTNREYVRSDTEVIDDNQGRASVLIRGRCGRLAYAALQPKAGS